MKALKITGVTQLIEINNTLEALQHEVLGYIETIPLIYGAAAIINEEGAINGMAPNELASHLFGVMVYGPALIVGVDDDEFCDVPRAWEYALRLNDIITDTKEKDRPADAETVTE